MPNMTSSRLTGAGLDPGKNTQDIAEATPQEQHALSSVASNQFPSSRADKA